MIKKVDDLGARPRRERLLRRIVATRCGQEIAETGRIEQLSLRVEVRISVGPWRLPRTGVPWDPCFREGSRLF